MSRKRPRRELTQHGKDGVTYTITGFGEHAYNLSKPAEWYVMHRHTVSVVMSGQSLGDYTVEVEVPGRSLVCSTGDTLSLKELSPKQLLQPGLKCKIKRKADPSKNQNAGTVWASAADVLTTTGDLRPL